MSADPKEAEALAQKIVEQLGPGEGLLLAMRIVILAGQQRPDDEKVIAAAQESIAAMKRLGVAIGVLPEPN